MIFVDLAWVWALPYLGVKMILAGNEYIPMGAFFIFVALYMVWCAATDKGRPFD